jgi:purine-binding chemotaxis protein CheW
VKENVIVQNEVSSEDVRKVWAARAARLARVPFQEEEGESLQYVPLRFGQELYAIEVQYVAEIRPLGNLTRVPRVPAWVAGVVNLRGRIHSVVDLKQFLGVAGEAATEEGRQGTTRAPEDGLRYLVVVETPALEVALLVDEVLPIQNVPVSQIGEALDRAQVARLEHVVGIVDVGDGKLMVILDLPVLLADKQFIVHDELG